MTIKERIKDLTEFKDSYEEIDDGGELLPEWLMYPAIMGIVAYVYHVISRIIELYF